MDMNRLFEEPYNAAEMLDIKYEDRQSHPLIERFFRYFVFVVVVNGVCDGKTINYLSAFTPFVITVRELTKLETRTINVNSESAVTEC